jgi:hypothetical protein
LKYKTDREGAKQYISTVDESKIPGRSEENLIAGEPYI